MLMQTQASAGELSGGGLSVKLNTPQMRWSGSGLSHKESMAVWCFDDDRYQDSGDASEKFDQRLQGRIVFRASGVIDMPES